MRVKGLKKIILMIVCVMLANCSSVSAAGLKSSYSITYKNDLTMGSVPLPPGWVVEDAGMKLDIGTYTCHAWNAGSGKKKKIQVTVKKIKTNIGSKRMTLKRGERLSDDRLPAVKDGTLSLGGKVYVVDRSGTYTCKYIPNDQVHYEICNVILNVKVRDENKQKPTVPIKGTDMQSKPSVILTSAPRPTEQTKAVKEPKAVKKPKVTRNPDAAKGSGMEELPAMPEITAEPTVGPTAVPAAATAVTPANSADNAEIPATEIPADTETPQATGPMDEPVSTPGLPTDNPAANPNYVPPIDATAIPGADSSDNQDGRGEAKTHTHASSDRPKLIIIIVAGVLAFIGTAIFISKKISDNKYKDFF